MALEIVRKSKNQTSEAESLHAGQSVGYVDGDFVFLRVFPAAAQRGATTYIYIYNAADAPRRTHRDVQTETRRASSRACKHGTERHGTDAEAEAHSAAKRGRATAPRPSRDDENTHGNTPRNHDPHCTTSPFSTHARYTHHNLHAIVLPPGSPRRGRRGGKGGTGGKHPPKTPTNNSITS